MFPLSATWNLLKTSYRLLEKLEANITSEEKEKQAKKFSVQIQAEYLQGNDAQSLVIQTILSYLKNWGIDISELNIPKEIKMDLRKAENRRSISVSTSTDIRKGLNSSPRGDAFRFEGDKRATAKIFSKKAAAKPIAKKATPKPSAKTATTKPIAKTATTKPIATKAVGKSAAKKTTSVLTSRKA
ncbi:hypothetical protein H8K52_06845 [Undibacterium seohonense]|uniref:Uncharacterized protein n=1 Tax=Undibacterium seohonense TaxID=1344950 RepID=A0ABR6X3Y7_9BURK|nr:hypothetical protein [Undibacterium seohonense]MBC3807059.1 hypothetical protein [Undibacterium seohonense]